MTARGLAAGLEGCLSTPGRRALRRVGFTVAGRAVPQGSTERAPRGWDARTNAPRWVTKDAESVYAWRRFVALAARSATQRLALEEGRSFDLFDGPCSLRVVFVLARPKTVRRLWPTVPPDVSKLVRAIEDALTGVVWVDDARAVEVYARKVYGAPERVDVEVELWAERPE